MGTILAQASYWQASHWLLQSQDFTSDWGYVSIRGITLNSH